MLVSDRSLFPGFSGCNLTRLCCSVKNSTAVDLSVLCVWNVAACPQFERLHSLRCDSEANSEFWLGGSATYCISPERNFIYYSRVSTVA